jgi:tripartite-type tricarboxylate transporter receptor subunit TctC
MSSRARRRLLAASLRWLAACAALAARPAAAQAWPAKPSRIVVPFGPGGAADLLARHLARRLSDRLGQPVVVENRPGAAGNVGMESVARSAPDGYTLLLATTGAAINPAMYRLAVDPLKDLVPVVQVSLLYLALFARRELPANTPQEVFELIRARPGAVSCASYGGGTQIACELLQSMAGARVLQVLYKGPGPALTDLGGGVVDLIVDTPASAVAQVQAGRIKAIGTTAPRARRTPVGDLPPLAQAMPGFQLHGWHGLFAPAGTPPDVVERLNREVNAILDEAESRKLLSDNDLELVGGSSRAFADLVRADHARYLRIAREAGIQPQ